MRLGASPSGRRELGEMRVVDKKSRSSDTVWSTGTYRRGTVRDRYNELEIMLEETAEPHRRLGYVFRAYDEGAAFRYVVPAQDGVEGFELLRERTEWRFPGKLRLVLPFPSVTRTVWRLGRKRRLVMPVVWRPMPPLYFGEPLRTMTLPTEGPLPQI